MKHQTYDKELLKSFSKKHNTVKILTVNRNKQHRTNILMIIMKIFIDKEWSV